MLGLLVELYLILVRRTGSANQLVRQELHASLPIYEINS